MWSGEAAEFWKQEQTAKIRGTTCWQRKNLVLICLFFTEMISGYPNSPGWWGDVFYRRIPQMHSEGTIRKVPCYNSGCHTWLRQWSSLVQMVRRMDKRMPGHEGLSPPRSCPLQRDDMIDSCHNAMQRATPRSILAQITWTPMKLSELNSSLEEILGVEELVKWHQEEANRQVLKIRHSTDSSPRFCNKPMAF